MMDTKVSLENKKPPAAVSAPSVKPSSFSLKKMVNFIEEVKQEFWRMSWTGGEDLKVYTQAVVGATLVFGLLIYGVDLTIRLLLATLQGLFQFIFG
jgi:preprotein translocase SecE subunit